MARGDYYGTGQAVLGQQSLGSVEWQLLGTQTQRMRKADGQIEFRDGFDHGTIGQRVEITPDDGGLAFHVVVTGVQSGRVTISSDGEMPWW